MFKIVEPGIYANYPKKDVKIVEVKTFQFSCSTGESPAVPMSKEEFYPALNVLEPEKDEGELLIELLVNSVKDKGKSKKKTPKSKVSGKKVIKARTAGRQGSIYVRKVNFSKEENTDSPKRFKTLNRTIAHACLASNITLPPPSEVLKRSNWKVQFSNPERVRVSKNGFIFARSLMHPLLSIFTMQEISRIVSAFWVDRKYCSGCDYFTSLASCTLISETAANHPKHVRVRENPLRPGNTTPFYEVINAMVDERRETLEN